MQKNDRLVGTAKLYIGFLFSDLPDVHDLCLPCYIGKIETKRSLKHPQNSQHIFSDYR